MTRYLDRYPARYNPIELEDDAFTHFYNRAVSMFWIPEVVRMDRDKADFNELKDHEKRIYKRTLMRQVIMDGEQTRSPMTVLERYATKASVVDFLAAWTFQESIHQSAYKYILKSVFDDPAKELSDMQTYEDVLTSTDWLALSWQGMEPFDATLTSYFHERVAFSSAFLVNFSWAERVVPILEGTTRMNIMIARDEALHAEASAYLLRNMLEDNFAAKMDVKILQAAEECVETETAWIKAVMDGDTIFGINEEAMRTFVENRVDRALQEIGFDPITSSHNPYSWYDGKINANVSQTALQESENVHYSQRVVNDVDWQRMDEKCLT